MPGDSLSFKARPIFQVFGWLEKWGHVRLTCEGNLNRRKFGNSGSGDAECAVWVLCGLCCAVLCGLCCVVLCYVDCAALDTYLHCSLMLTLKLTLRLRLHTFCHVPRDMCYVPVVPCMCNHMQQSLHSFQHPPPKTGLISWNHPWVHGTRLESRKSHFLFNGHAHIMISFINWGDISADIHNSTKAFLLYRDGTGNVKLI